MSLNGNNVSETTRQFWRQQQRESAQLLYDLLLDESTTDGGANMEDALLLVALQQKLGIEDRCLAFVDLLGDKYEPVDGLDERQKGNREILENWSCKWLDD